MFSRKIETRCICFYFSYLKMPNVLPEKKQKKFFVPPPPDTPDIAPRGPTALQDVMYGPFFLLKTNEKNPPN